MKKYPSSCPILTEDGLYYSDIAELLGEVVVKTSIGDYQGEYLFLIANATAGTGKEYRFLTMAYGSCSHCDVLQSMEDDLPAQQEYLDSWWSSQRDTGMTSDEMIMYLLTKDWYALGYSWGNHKYITHFVRECLTALGANPEIVLAFNSDPDGKDSND